MLLLYLGAKLPKKEIKLIQSFPGACSILLGAIVYVAFTIYQKRRYVSLNSRIIHQRETYIYFTIFALIGVLIANMFIHMVFILAYPLLIGLIVQVVLLQKMKKPFYRSGKELTEQLKLKNIFLVESNILGDEEGTVYEVHQMPFFIF